MFGKCIALYLWKTARKFRLFYLNRGKRLIYQAEISTLINGIINGIIPFRSRKGCCKGPALARFCSYTSELFDIVGRHLPSVHFYADDTKLYLAFSPNVQGDDSFVVKALCDCIMDLRKCMIRDRLIAPAGFRPRGRNPRRHPNVPRVKKKYRITVSICEAFPI